MSKQWWYLSHYKGMLPGDIAKEGGVATISVQRQLYRYDEGVEPLPDPFYVYAPEVIQ